SLGQTYFAYNVGGGPYSVLGATGFLFVFSPSYSGFSGVGEILAGAGTWLALSVSVGGSGQFTLYDQADRSHDAHGTITGASVPEPATALLFALACVALACRAAGASEKRRKPID